MLLSTNIKSFKKTALLISTLILSVSLSGCAIFGSSSKNEDKSRANQVSNQSQQRHYNRAARQLKSNNFEQAIETYNEFIVKYPFGTLSERARLERIFILNKLGEAEEASVSIDRFINQHPLHPNLDYAFYMRGVVSFEKKRVGFFQRLAGAKEVLRNKSNYEASFLAFSELLQEFPDSRYASDAKERMIYLRNNMALFELSAANFYADRNAHIAAINRAEFIVENYDQAPAVIDALELMASSYEKIGLTKKADETRLLLTTNYSNIEGVVANNKKKKSLIKLPNLNPLRLFKKNS